MLKIPTWGREKTAQAHDETLHPFPQGSTFSFAQEKGRLASGSLFIWLLRTPATSGTTNRADFGHSWHTKPQFLGEKKKKSRCCRFPYHRGRLRSDISNDSAYINAIFIPQPSRSPRIEQVRWDAKASGPEEHLQISTTSKVVAKFGIQEDSAGNFRLHYSFILEKRAINKTSSLGQP